VGGAAEKNPVGDHRLVVTRGLFARLLEYLVG
jgi:hypothetical protein